MKVQAITEVPQKVVVFLAKQLVERLEKAKSSAELQEALTDFVECFGSDNVATQLVKVRPDTRLAESKKMLDETLRATAAAFKR